MNTRVTGHLAEMRVVQKLLELGYQVLSEVVPQGRTDYWIRCEDDKYVKLQVKSIQRYDKPSKGIVRRMKIASHGSFKTFEKHYSTGEVDFFIGVLGTVCYIVPHGVAYSGISKKSLNVGKQFLEAWNLLPRPYGEQISEEIEESKQQELFVA